MPYDRFLIQSFNSGLQRNQKPFQIMEDAFATLNNAYVFRSSVIKRFGGVHMGYGYPSAQMAPLFSRLRVNIGTTNGAGVLAGNVGAALDGTHFKVGQQFSIGTEIFTVVNPAAGANAMNSTAAVPAPTRTYNLATGAYSFAGAAALTAVFFYPAEPVMGLAVYETGPSINDEPSYAWDTQWAYVFTGGAWTRSFATLNAKLVAWHGTNSDFFQIANWRGVADNNTALFVTNYFVVNQNGASNVLDDPIWSFDGTNWIAHDGTTNAGADGFYFLPGGNPIYTGPFISTARIIVGFKDRLVLLNTIENNNSGGAGVGTNKQYQNRARYSHNGSPFSVTAWYEPNQVDGAGNVADGAGFIDAPTEEHIVSAQFIKDRLIVFFEESTWELAYTGNQVLPFVWQKINTELGSESLLSSVPFDKQILTMSNVGVHACNGANVERIDNKIPDEVFEIRNRSDGVKRVAGIRDYWKEVVYWTFPDSQQNALESFNNKVLLYNYRNDTWAFNDDCITVFGYFEQQQGLTWANANGPWFQANAAWAAGVLQSNFRQIIAGNQQGFVFIVAPEVSRNAAVMQITTIVIAGGFIVLTIIDHTLAVGDYLYFENFTAPSDTTLNGTIHQVAQIVDANTIRINLPLTYGGPYVGGATATRVSIIDITTKQWNPYLPQGKNVFIQRIDFAVTNTPSTEITVDYAPSSSNLSMITTGTASNSIMGTGVLECFPYNTLEVQQETLWHPVYFQTQGNFIQLDISWNDDQARDPNISLGDFELHAIVLNTKPTNYRLG